MFNISIFADRLNELIFDSKISVVDTAKAMDVPKSTIYRYINEQRLPNMDMLKKLADYFKCSINFLIGLDNENYLKTFLSYPAFSIRFKFLLNKYSVTKYKLIKDTGIPESIIYSWQSGKSQPNLDSIIRLAGYFDCSIDYLIGRTDIR